MTFKNLTTIQLLATATLGKIASDGLWTDNDWYDTEADIGIHNGEPYSNTSEVYRRIKAPKTVDGEDADYRERANVKRVMELVDEDDWDYYFGSFRNDIYTYENFLKAVGKFPAFCDENNRVEEYTDDDMCARELATVFAHYVKETSYNSTWEESENGIDLWRQGLYEVNSGNCGPGEANEGSSSCEACSGGWAEDAWPCEAQYFSRGPFQIQQNFNYGQFSNAYEVSSYDSKMFVLENPEVVAEDGYYAFGSSIWYYMMPVNPKPSMHDVVTGFWQPNAADTAAGIKGGFGTTINLIAGSCSFASQRIGYYQEFLADMGLPINEANLSCVGESASFPSNGSAAIVMNFFEPEGDKCVLAPWQTEYALSARDDYKRCICENFGAGEDDCPQDGVAEYDFGEEFDIVIDQPIIPDPIIPDDDDVVEIIPQSFWTATIPEGYHRMSFAEVTDNLQACKDLTQGWGVYRLTDGTFKGSGYNYALTEGNPEGWLTLIMKTQQ